MSNSSSSRFCLCPPWLSALINLDAAPEFELQLFKQILWINIDKHLRKSWSPFGWGGEILSAAPFAGCFFAFFVGIYWGNLARVASSLGTWTRASQASKSIRENLAS